MIVVTYMQSTLVDVNVVMISHDIAMEYQISAMKLASWYIQGGFIGRGNAMNQTHEHQC